MSLMSLEKVEYATGDDDDVELTEFRDEIESWVIEELQKIGWIRQKSILNKMWRI
jgi:N utilization substance protein A